MDLTTLGLKKPLTTEAYDIQIFNDNANKIDELITADRQQINTFTPHLTDLITDADGAHGLKVESGIFTPFIRGDSVSGENTYAVQNGFYEKIGKTVNFHLYVELTQKDAAMSGAINIGGLPFISNITDNYFVSCVISYAILTKGTKQLAARITPGGNFVYLLFITDTTDYIYNSEILNNSSFMISGSYQAS